MVLAAVGHGNKARILLVFRVTHAVAQRVPGCRRHGTDDHRHGLASVNAVGTEVCVVVAAACLNVSLVIVDLQSAGVNVQNIAHKGEIDKLTAAGLELVDVSEQR